MGSAKKGVATACFVLALFLGGTTRAAEKKIALPEDNPMGQLKPGSGADVARNNCGICHSTDYIVRQPGRTAAQWEAEVKKMTTVFGAPISDEDAKTIANYLATAYGPESQSPVPHRTARSRSKATAHRIPSPSTTPAKPRN